MNRRSRPRAAAARSSRRAAPPPLEKPVDVRLAAVKYSDGTHAVAAMPTSGAPGVRLSQRTAGRARTSGTTPSGAGSAAPADPAGADADAIHRPAPATRALARRRWSRSGQKDAGGPTATSRRTRPASRATACAPSWPRRRRRRRCTRRGRRRPPTCGSRAPPTTSASRSVRRRRTRERRDERAPAAQERRPAPGGLCSRSARAGGHAVEIANCDAAGGALAPSAAARRRQHPARPGAGRRSSSAARSRPADRLPAGRPARSAG